jgi:hypothetical protein
MIIVDAMQFAFMHPDGATLCFITGDVDYAYLLAVLQRPKWQTIVISKGTMQSMLHVNCDMRMRWETDILQLRHSPAPLERDVDQVGHSLLPAGNDEVNYRDVLVGGLGSTGERTPFEPLTADEEWEDDVELLRTVVRREMTDVIGSSPAVRKSRVGQELRQTNPARFPHREAIKEFFIRAIEMGVVIETGDGATKMLSLPIGKGHIGPVISLTHRVPVPLHDIPERVLEMCIVMPFVLFAPWNRCPSGNKFPERTFVQSHGTWAILLFHTLTDAQRTVHQLPWLCVGTLVDWRQVQDAVHMVPCSLCNALRPIEEMKQESKDEERFNCPECNDWAIQTIDEKAQAVRRVVSMLEMMADNDDIYIAENILSKQLCILHPEHCSSRKLGALWIEEAVTAKDVTIFKRSSGKAKLVCLSNQYDNALAPFPPDTVNTSNEESHVVDLLWEAKGCLPRVKVIESLKSHFETMETTFMRNKVFLNSQEKGHFFLAKGTTAQAVGLTKGDAAVALEIGFGAPAKAFCESEKLPVSTEPITENTDSMVRLHEKCPSASSFDGDGGQDDDNEEDDDYDGDDDDDDNLAALLPRKVGENSTDSSISSTSHSLSRDWRDLRLPVARPVAKEGLVAFRVQSGAPGGSILSGKAAFDRLRDVKGNTATKNLYVYGYGDRTTESHLRKLFSQYAVVVDVCVKSGFSFVNTTDRSKAIIARENLVNTPLNGGFLGINFAKN